MFWRLGVYFRQVYQFYNWISESFKRLYKYKTESIYYGFRNGKIGQKLGDSKMTCYVSAEALWACQPQSCQGFKCFWPFQQLSAPHFPLENISHTFYEARCQLNFGISAICSHHSASFGILAAILERCSPRIWLANENLIKDSKTLDLYVLLVSYLDLSH